MPRCCVCVRPVRKQITGLSTVLLSHLVKRYRSPPQCPVHLCPSLSVSCPPKALLCLGLQVVVPFGCTSSVSEKNSLGENSDRRVKKKIILALTSCLSVLVLPPLCLYPPLNLLTLGFCAFLFIDMYSHFLFFLRGGGLLELPC